MVVIAVALGAFLLCLGGTIGASLLQIRQDQITDTYEATYAGVTQADIAALKEVPEIARVGTYYVLSTENSPRGFQATYLYVDQDLLYTFRHQMSLAQGRLPQGDHEVALGADWLAQYANGAGLGIPSPWTPPASPAPTWSPASWARRRRPGRSFPWSSPTPP